MKTALLAKPDKKERHFRRRAASTGRSALWGYLDQIFVEAPIGMAVIDKHLCYVKTNRSLASYHGLSPEEMLNRSIFTMNPRWAEKTAVFLRRVLATGMPIVNQDFDGALKTGGPRQNWLINYFPLRDRQGRMTGINLMVQDMTAAHRLKNDVVTASQEWEHTFDAVKDLILIMDREHKIIRANTSARKEYRLPDEKTVGGFCYTFLHKAGETSECLSDEAARTRGHVERERYDERKDRWFLESVDPIFNDQRLTTGVIKIVKDITESKRSLLEANENRLELAHIRRVSTIGELAASIAHELNQPLTAILSNAQAALRFLNSDPPDYNEIRDILKDVVADDKRAGEVIRRLRVLLKKKELELSPLQLNDVVTSVVEMLHSDSIRRKASILLDLESDLPLTFGDDIQLQQVLLNLVMNGLDAVSETPLERRHVTIRTYRDGSDQLRLSVKDRGHGIGKQHLERIFSPFFTTKKEGLGMGLAVAHSIMEGHKGRLWAENNPEGGAVFHLSLPVYRSPLEDKTSL